ncbi:RNA helicase [Trifolium repens]|nr:RNA helicase [Trifolium repens]
MLKKITFDIVHCSLHRTFALPLFHQQTSSYGRFAFHDVSSDDDSDIQFAASSHSQPRSQQQSGDSALENIDSWRWKLTMLLRNKGEQEVVSNEKKDRRDFLQLETLASRMGLYSRQYARVVVFSKVPLPNYCPDLDD